ncbi:GntR family transcriptional regulator [Micromonospora sp. WMMD882]|uniref:GntR family transcriptional regulator n=1 Tax=Micromonospora sp. WMMD882 TaxID=3015151 RepID=UPI00248AED2B|nr:GntR family transcriptional regulator [Micromonospora sp. WMMD882]WBB78458.1 GntR family transcriptional regulator [Micromonospora sp. WMMD882]
MLAELPPIDRVGDHPLYLQVKSALQAVIDGGGLPHGARMPSESAVAGHYGVSRHVVRQALERLVTEGRLTARHGAGYFVNHRRIHLVLPSLTSFSEAMRTAGVAAELRVVEQGFEESTPELRRKLDTPRARRLYRLLRVGTAGDEPLVLIEAWYPSRVARVVDHRMIEETGVYQQLKAAGLRPARAENELRVSFVDPPVASLLGLPWGSPVIVTHSLTFDQDDRPMEFVRELYRADRFVFDYGSNSERRPRP